VETAQRSLALQVSVRYRKNIRDLGVQDVPVELQVSDDVRVRLANPPPKFDDKGNPKKYTQKELKSLKGPGNTWGYPGDFDSLKQNQVVHVFLKKPKEAPKTSTGGKKTEKDSAEAKPIVYMIYILQEPVK
jgi:hypothetical protein